VRCLKSDLLNPLLVRFTELLVGESTEEKVEMVTVWALYSHMQKVMPDLIKHWEASHPEKKKEIREVFLKVQEWNQQNKEMIRNHQSRLNSEKNPGN
jgi:hypoxanthine phosphoribosyltransferase